MTGHRIYRYKVFVCISTHVNKEEPKLRKDKEVRMNYSGTDIRSGISILIVMVIGAFCSTTVIAQEQVKLVSVKPTVFFVRKDNVLTQLGEATVNNLSQEQE